MLRRRPWATPSASTPVRKAPPCSSRTADCEGCNRSVIEDVSGIFLGMSVEKLVARRRVLRTVCHGREQLDTTCCSRRAGASTSVAGRPGPPNRTAADLPAGLGASGRSPRAEVAPLATSAGLCSDEPTFRHPRVSTFSHPFPLGSGRAERTLAFLCGGAHDRHTHATASRMSAPPLGATSSTHLTLRSGLDPGSSPRERERHLEALTQERGHP